MSQDHNHLNHATWGCKTDARPYAYPDIDPPKYSVAELIGYLKEKKLDLACAECGTQAPQIPGPQILGEGLLRFDRRAGRGDDPRLHQKTGDGGQAVGSVVS
jgi:hypothetical protein